MKKRIYIGILLALFAAVTAYGDFDRQLELGRRCIALDKYEEARETLEPLLDEHPDNATLNRLLKQVYRQLKDNAALLNLLEREIAANPRDANLWVEVGQLRLSQGQTESAMDAFDTAMELAPNDQAVILNIFYSYRAWGYIDEGIELLREARKNGDQPALFAMEIASLHEIQGDWDAAADEYALYLKQFPDRFAQVERRMNEVAADPEQLEELEKAVEKLRDRGVEGDRVDRLLARLQIRQGKYQSAVESLIDAEKKRGAKGIYVLGFMREAQTANAHEAVVKAGEYMADAEPRFANEAMLLMASSLRELNRIDEALTILSELENSKSRPIAAAALTMHGEIELYDMNNPDEAETKFTAAIESYPRQPSVGEAYHGLADVHFRRGDFDKAEETIRGRRAVNPEDPWALYSLGELAFYRGSIDTAGSLFRSVALSFPESEEANDAVEYLALIADAGKSENLSEIAEVLKEKRQGKLDQAIEDMGNLIDDLGEELWLDLLLWYRSEWLLEKDNIALARKDLNKIAENYPDGYHAARAIETLGDLAADEDDYTRASEYYNRILVDYPGAVNIESVREKLRNIPGNI